MPIGDVLAQREPEILLHHQRAAEGHVVGPLLDAVQLGGQHGERVVGRVADQEAQVDQVVRVGQFREQLEVLGEVGGSVLERGEDEDALLVLEGFRGGFDGV